MAILSLSVRPTTRSVHRGHPRLALLAIAAIVVTACGSSDTPSPSALSSIGPGSSSAPSDATGSSTAPSDAAGSSTPTSDTSVLNVAVPSLGSQSWEPWLITSDGEPILEAVGETLIRVNPKTQALEGGLAESWSLSPDGLTWDFKVRPNIPFQDGFGDVTADDVKFSWEQYTQKDSTQASAQILRQAIDGDINNFEVVSPLEFRLHGKVPTYNLPSTLSNVVPGMVVQSKKYWETQPDVAKTHPIGTGAYKFVSSTPGLEVKLERVDNHWRQTGQFKEIDFKVVSDPAARLAQVVSGDLDIAPIPPSLIGEAKASTLNVISTPDTGDWTVVFGGSYPGDAEHGTPDAPWIQASAPEKGLAVRQALQYAIDTATIHDRLMAGLGTITAAPVVQYPSNPELTDPSWVLPTFDPERAKALLAEGGYPDGFEVTIPSYDRSASPGIPDITEAIAGYFEAIGLKVNRQTMDYTQDFFPKVRAQETANWIYVYPAPFKPDTGAILESFVPGKTTVRAYDDDTESAYEQLQTAADPEQRYAIARDLGSKLIDSKLVLPLFTAAVPYAVSPKIASWDTIPGLAEMSNLESITAH
jgi:peptide/nickel transport system substrate-binding protein